MATWARIRPWWDLFNTTIRWLFYRLKLSYVSRLKARHIFTCTFYLQNIYIMLYFYTQNIPKGGLYVIFECRGKYLYYVPWRVNSGSESGSRVCRKFEFPNQKQTKGSKALPWAIFKKIIETPRIRFILYAGPFYFILSNNSFFLIPYSYSVKNPFS